MKILFFDGHCNLCNSTVDWLVRQDHRRVLQFASLQGKTAHEKLPAQWIADLNTAVYFRDGKTFKQSAAVLRAVADMGGVWRLAFALLVLPPFLRDAGYQIVAQNRYRFFGRRDTCRLPTPEERARLLP